MAKVIDRNLLTALRKDIDAALASVAKKHGVTLETGSARFAETYATFKLNVALVGKGGMAASKAAETFKLMASLWSMKASDLNKPVVLPWGNTGDTYDFVIVGARRKSAAAILCKGDDGKIWCYKPSQVLEALGRKADAKRERELGM